MNNRRLQYDLATAYSYRPLNQCLPDSLCDLIYTHYVDSIPKFLKISGDDKPLYTLNNSLVCNCYNRIVVGDYGAFIEIKIDDANTPIFEVAMGQEYRINDEKYSKNVKYHWYTVDDKSNIKIYFQQKTVSYADYQPQRFYVSVYEIKESVE